MNSFILRGVLASAAAFGLAAGFVRPAGAEEIQVVKSGKYYGAVDAYRVGDYYYLPAKESARVYGGQVYWYAVRAQVGISMRGRQILFSADSRAVDVNGRAVSMPREMIVRASQAFVPVEFFESRDFSDVAGVDTKFNPKTKLLLVDQRSNVGPLRWFTYGDHTRVVLEISETLSYSTSNRGRLGLAIEMPNGNIDWSERTDIGDGVVESVHLYQETQNARLMLKMQDDADGAKVMEFKNPRRIVIDVLRASGSSPSPVKAPEPAASDLPPAVSQGRSAAADALSIFSAAKDAVVEALPEKAGKEEKRERARAPRVFRVAIDAGHGGKDGGAVGRRGTLEKDINLNAAKELSLLLKQEGLFDVMLTRDSDGFVKLGERSKLANNYNADIFVSLHCNAHTSTKESGFEIYFLSERASDPEAERLAEFENSVLAMEGEGEMEGAAASVLYALAKTEFINDAAELAGLMTRELGRRVDMSNRGVRQAAFYVLRGTNSPAVLVEMGFVTNSKDEAKLESSKYRRKIVEGLYAGIVEFAKRRVRGEEGGP